MAVIGQEIKIMMTMEMNLMMLTMIEVHISQQREAIEEEQEVVLLEGENMTTVVLH